MIHPRPSEQGKRQEERGKRRVRGEGMRIKLRLGVVKRQQQLARRLELRKGVVGRSLVSKGWTCRRGRDRAGSQGEGVATCRRFAFNASLPSRHDFFELRS